MNEVPSGSMNLLGHLGELRKRLFWSLLVLTIASGVCLSQVKKIWDFLLIPLPKSGLVHLINVAPTESLVIDFKISILAGMIVSAPFWLYQFYAFLVPGLYGHEKKSVLGVSFFASFFFVLGSSFSYLVVVPTSLGFLNRYAGDVALQNWTQVSYFGFVVRMVLAFAIMFQLPVVVWFLARMGLVTAQFLWSQFRIAFLLILIVSAMLTPPEVISMLLLSLPLTLLYLISIGVAHMVNKEGADV